LLFVITDDTDEQRDRAISEHVLRMHRYLQPGVEEGQFDGGQFQKMRTDCSSVACDPGTPAIENLVQHLDVGGDEQDARTLETPVFEKFNPLLHGGVTTSSGRSTGKKKEVLSIAFVKKYIQYAKNRIHPVLTKGAADYIVGVYAALRNDDLASNQKRVSTVTTP
jgi:DNA replication licensing factor MCM3